MDFGRLPSLEGVSFTLPPLPERSRRLLAWHAGARAEASAEGASHGPWLRSGAPAWARKDWVGRLYPSGTPDKEFLRTYARRVDAIELNASYYRVPSEEVIDAWCAEVPERFRFCPKVHQSITHRRALEETANEAYGFALRMLRLGRKLGPAFVQLPPWFEADGLNGVDRLLASLPEAFRVAVEFRHPSWFAGGELREEAVRVLEQHGAGAVITDVAGRRDACHASITAPFVIVRFVGNGLHPSDLPRADAWLERLAEWRALGLDEAYFFVHQPDDALAPELLAHVAKDARRRGLDMPDVQLGAAQLDLFGATAPPAWSPADKPKSPAKKAPPRR